MRKEKGFKEIVRSTYDRQALLYSEYSGIQRTNLENLVSYAEQWNVKICPGLLLDAGCGIPNEPILNAKLFSEFIYGYIGLDYSFNMLSTSSLTSRSLKIEGDLEAIPIKTETISVVLSNSVLHWLNFPEQNINPLKGCKEIYRVLQKEGIFLLSVSGVGTARKFQKAYYEVVQSVPDSFFENKMFFRRDPIGSMGLDELIHILELSGFAVSHALMKYEPVFFKLTDDYINHVKAYGEDAYLSAFVEQHRNTVWDMISMKFKDIVGEYNYKHDQFMIYAAALKE